MAVGSRPLVPSRLTPGGGGHSGSLHAPRTKVGAFVALTKPRIIELLLITTLPTMILAQQGMPRLGLMAATLLGGALAAGGANAVNMYVDRDIDRLMPRTQGRPLVTGAVSPTAALVFACGLLAASFVVLWSLVNLLSSLLALSAAAFYVFVYTLWLKRTSTRNIVIGGAAGAVPVLVGWAAVTNSLSLTPVVLFLAVFFWTPPHFWALAIRYADDYRAASVPMLPAVASVEVTSRRMTGYTLVLWGLTVALWPIAGTGWIYGATAIVLGAVFTWGCIDLQRHPTTRRAMRVFSFSITYVTLLFGALALDTLAFHGW
jgi:protoheme IX farnesyltransferase